MPTLREIQKWQKASLKNLPFKPYSLKEITSIPSKYYIIFGERSNGKTYAALERGLIKWALEGKELGYMRRYDDDVKPRLMGQVFAPFEANGFIEFITDGKFNRVVYSVGKFYFARTDEKGKTTKAPEPFGYAFSLNIWERYKSTSYPSITTIIFDEFITNSYYLIDEFTHFQNMLSTIIRHRNDVEIFMLGNTVNRFCPYFGEMGLKHIKEMKPGTIDKYVIGEEQQVTVTVEYTHPTDKGKQSDEYFAFDNPKLKMITSGDWEIGIYPHLPPEYHPYTPEETLFRFFIVFDENIVKCDVVQKGEATFIFCAPKKDPIKDPDHDFIYSTEDDPRPNWRKKITKPILPVEKNIARLFKMEKVFFATNECGEIVNNYFKWCGVSK